jgi:hypothetical protein
VSSEMIVVRLPTGQTEFRIGAAGDLKVGDKIKRGEEECEVVGIHDDEHGHRVVTVGLPREALQAS